MKGIYGLFVALSVVVLFGCQTNEEFVNPVYTCDCGSVTWNGSSRQFLMAEYLHQPDTNLLSRRYYTTVNLQSETETEPHHLNISFYVDTVIQQLFTLEDDDLQLKIEEVNYNDPFIPIRYYEADIAFVSVVPSLLNGPETVSFQWQITEMLNGSPAGFPFAVEGSFTVPIIY